MATTNRIGKSVWDRIQATLCAFSLVALANLTWLQPAAARLKFVDTAEQNARADAIVVGRITSVAVGTPARFKLRIERSLFGTMKATLQIDPAYWQIDWPAKTKCKSSLTQTAYMRSQFG